MIKQSEKETVQIKKSIVSGNIKLDSIKKQISTYTVSDTSQVPALSKQRIKMESTIDTLNQKVAQLTLELTL